MTRDRADAPSPSVGGHPLPWRAEPGMEPGMWMVRDAIGRDVAAVWGEALAIALADLANKADEP